MAFRRSIASLLDFLGTLHVVCDIVLCYVYVCISGKSSVFKQLNYFFFFKF